MSHYLQLLKEQIEKLVTDPKESNHTLINEYKSRINTILFNKQNNIENLNQLLTIFVNWFVEVYNEQIESTKENKLLNYKALFKEFKNSVQSS